MYEIQLAGFLDFASVELFFKRLLPTKLDHFAFLCVRNNFYHPVNFKIVPPSPTAQPFCGSENITLRRNLSEPVG